MSRPARPLTRPAFLTLAALFVLPVLLWGPREAGAGAPPTSWTYRDREHKFSMRMMRDYKPVPQKTDEKTIVCRFRDPDSKGTGRGSFPIDIQVVRIALDGKDEPVTTGGGPAEDAAARMRARMGFGKPKDVWMAMMQFLRLYRLDAIGQKTVNAEREEFKAIKSRDKEKIAGKLWQFSAPIRHPRTGETLHVTVAEFVKDGWAIGFIMTCGTRLEKDYGRRFKAIAKSFKWMDSKAKDVESLDQLDGINITARKRREIETGMVKGWDVIVSPKKNYIILYNTKNNKNNLLARVIAKRIEMIREQIYEVQFPPAQPITTVCIVRVCADAKEYWAYGGPRGSAGYWSSGDEELVFYDASASKQPDDNTLSVLYHEAFHQYIFYSVGNVAPHSWFNEGHGDYYAGAELKGRKFVIKPFAWRVGVVKNAIVQGPRGFSEVKTPQGTVRKQWERQGYTPLEHLTRFTQREYYAYPGVSYAQGWSLIYFLRETVPNNKKYNAKWGKILDTYFDVLQREVNKRGALVRGGEGTQDGDEKDGEKKKKKKDDAGEQPDAEPDTGKGDPQPEPEPKKPEGGDAKPDAQPESDAQPKSEEGADKPAEPPKPEDGKGGDKPGDGDAGPAEPPKPEDGEGEDTPEDGDGDGKGEDKPAEPPPGVARVFNRGLGGAAALQKAVEEAFKGVDWAEFEKAWLKATKSV